MRWFSPKFNTLYCLQISLLFSNSALLQCPVICSAFMLKPWMRCNLFVDMTPGFFLLLLWLPCILFVTMTPVYFVFYYDFLFVTMTPLYFACYYDSCVFCLFLWLLCILLICTLLLWRFLPTVVYTPSTNM